MFQVDAAGASSGEAQFEAASAIICEGFHRFTQSSLGGIQISDTGLSCARGTRHQIADQQLHSGGYASHERGMLADPRKVAARVRRLSHHFFWLLFGLCMCVFVAEASDHLVL